MRFTKRSLRTAKMQQSEVHHVGIEVGVGKGQLLGITFLKVDAGITSAGLFDHFGRKVDSDCSSTARRRGSRDVARAASNIEYSSAFCYEGCIEQRRHSLDRYSGKTFVITRSNFLPALMFELTEVAHG